MEVNEQTIYINIDDSGKLVNNQKVTVYAGLIFTIRKEATKSSLFPTRLVYLTYT